MDEMEHAQFRDKYMVSLYLENHRVTFEVDCGAAVTLVSERWLKRIFLHLKIQRTELRLRSYCKQDFKPLCFVKVKVRDIDCIHNLNMYVVCYDRSPLLGREWINQLRILGKVKSSLKEIEDVKSLEVYGRDKLELLFNKYPDIVREEFPSMS